MSVKPILIVFIKNPELGKVKTRLAQDVGDPMALKIYKALLDHTKNVVLQINVERFLFYSENISSDDGWSEQHFQKHLQAEGDLGNRMTTAFQFAFDQGAPVLIVGSDCAQIKANIIEEGFAALKDHDFVIGPALDGGYYLLGMRSFNPSVFKNILWSSESVFSSTINVIKNQQATYHLLPELSDIDYIHDWEKYGWPLND